MNKTENKILHNSGLSKQWTRSERTSWPSHCHKTNQKTQTKPKAQPKPNGERFNSFLWPNPLPFETQTLSIEVFRAENEITFKNQFSEI